MAYTNDEYLFTVRGTVGDFEAWTNTWSVIDLNGPRSPQAAANVLNAFYEDITGFASWLSNVYVARGCTARNMGLAVSTDMGWGEKTGSSNADLLPTQVGMKMTLRAGSHRGGPFLNGFVETANTSNGRIATACIDDFKTACELLFHDLAANDYALAVHRPTAATMTGIGGWNIGNRWDVIRTRANDTPEVRRVLTLA